MICVFLEVITECEKERVPLSPAVYRVLTTNRVGLGTWGMEGRLIARCILLLHPPHPPPPPRLLSNLSSAHRSSSLSTVSSLNIGLFALKLAPTVWLLAKRTLAEVTQSENIWLLAKRPMQEKSLSRRIQWALIYAHMTRHSLLFQIILLDVFSLFNSLKKYSLIF